MTPKLFKSIITKLMLLLFVSVAAIVPVLAIEELDDSEELFKAPKVANGAILNIKDCVALAFKNSPKVRRKKYELDILKSRVGVAKSRFFPVIGAGVGFNYERNSNGIYYDKKFRNLPYVGVTVNQLVWDFGKTNANIKMEEFYKIGAEYEFVDEVCHTLFDIKQKYYNLLRAIALKSLLEKDVEINKDFLKIAKSNPDKSTAEVNLTEAKIRLIEADKELKNAKFDLSNAMYLDNHIDYKIKETPTFSHNINKDLSLSGFVPIAFPFKGEDAVNIAYENSPDLQVLINTKNAMEQSLKFVKKSYMPELSADAGYGLNNTYNATNNSLQVGVGLSAGVNLKELKHNIDIAKAEVNIANNEILLFKKDLYYEVQRALNNLALTEEQVPISKNEIIQATKNLELVKSGYVSNKLDYTALQNARKDYIKSHNHYISSLYDYNLAIIQAEMALHYHIVDIHHKTEHAIHSHADELLEHLVEALNCSQDEPKSKKTKRKPKNNSKL